MDEIHPTDSYAYYRNYLFLNDYLPPPTLNKINNTIITASTANMIFTQLFG